MLRLYRRGSKRHRATTRIAASVIALTSSGIPTLVHAAESATLTPIKHAIIIIGENRTFDHIFATYKPVNNGEQVLNLLSQGIVNADGSPGPSYGAALQYKAFDTTQYQLSPPKTPYVILPPALVGGTSTPYVCEGLGITTGTSCVSPANLAAARIVENGLADGYYQFLLTGGTGQTNGTPDTRLHYNGQDASHLPPGPFQITSPTFPYDAYAASPVHRYYQMFQQLDCDAAAQTAQNGWGCLSDLFPWVEVSVGVGKNGAARPAGFNNMTTGEGSTSMGFYNVRTRRHLFHERQFSSVRVGRDRRQPHHARHRRCGLVQRWQRQRRRAAQQPGRSGQSGHPCGRLYERAE